MMWKRPGVSLMAFPSYGVPAAAAPSCSAAVVSSHTLILSDQRDPALCEIRPSYRFILGQIRQTLAGGAGLIEQAGISDLILAGRKFSGTRSSANARSCCTTARFFMTWTCH